MIFSDVPWFELATATLAGITAAQLLRTARNRSLRREAELEAAARALETYYDALAAIADDPALPLRALEMITNFSEGISDEKFCEGLADVLVATDFSSSSPEPEKMGSAPSWFDEMEVMRAHRPDLAENFFKAIASGLVAAFLRWPGNSHKIERMVEALAMGERRGAVLAEKVSRAHQTHSHRPGGLAPA